MKTKIDQFREDIKTSQPVIVCMKCGSTRIDQNFRNQIRCYQCQNISIWDADRFTVAREGKEHDVIAGFEDAEQPNRAGSLSEGGWRASRSSIVQSILPLMHAITELPSVFEGDGKSKIDKTDFDKLLRLWTDARTNVNAVFENLLTRDDAIIK